MNLNQLKIFYLAAKYKNLTAAAEELNITQPAVTKGIQRLQEFYEVRFVNRFGKKLALTDAGRVLYDVAEKIFEMERLAEDGIRDFQQHERGHVRIDTSESFGAYYLPSLINPFSHRHPKIRVSVNILPTEHVVRNTLDLKNDLGFISYSIENSKLKIREILEDRLVIIVPSNDALAHKKQLDPMDLMGRAMIMHETGSAPRRAIDAYIHHNNLAVDVPMELSNNEAIKRAVEEGIGIALISRKVADEEIQAGKLKAIPLADHAVKRRFHLIHHKDKHLSFSLRRLIEIVDRWAAEYHDELDRA
jgi:DNA-binding transcriptional LysR family regulator